MARNRCSNNCASQCAPCSEEAGIVVRDTDGTFYPVVDGVLTIPAPD